MHLPAAAIAIALLVSQVSTASREPALVVTEDRVELRVPFDTTGTRWDPGRSPEGMLGYACWVTMPMLGDTFGFGFAHGSRYPAGGMLTFRQLLDESRTTFWRSESGVHTPLAVDSLFVRLDADGFVVVLLDRLWASRVLGVDLDSAVVVTMLPDDQRASVPVVRHAAQGTLRAARVAYAAADSTAADEARRVYPARRIARTLLSLCHKGKILLFHLDGRPIPHEEARLILSDRARAVMDSLKVDSFALAGNSVYCTRVSLFRIDSVTGRTDVAIQGSTVGEWWSYHDRVRASSTGRFVALADGNGTEHVVVYDLHRRRVARRFMDDPDLAWLPGLDVFSNPGHTYDVSTDSTTYYRTDPARYLIHGADGFYSVDSQFLYRYDEHGAKVHEAPIPAQRPQPKPTNSYPRIIGFVGSTVFIEWSPAIFAYDALTGELTEIVGGGDGFAGATAAVQYFFVDD